MTARRHHNIFVYYRGPSQKTSERDAHRQLEDNATKALINTLEHSDPVLARSFVSRFAADVAKGWPDKKPATYFLQRGPDKVPPGRRMILGLSIDGEIDPKAKKLALPAGTRIDAAIEVPHGGLVAIETKVVEYLDPHQLARHRTRWQIAPSDQALVRWVDVWSWARAELNEAPDVVTRFLLRQLCEYLETLGFGRWAGFRKEDFAQFAEWSWDYQPVLRARMRAGLERVLEVMDPADVAQLGTIEAGTLPKTATAAWAQTNRGVAIVNLSLQLHPHEVQLNIDGWRKPQALRVENWLLNHPERCPNLNLVVHERNPTIDRNGKALWQPEKPSTVAVTLTPDQVRRGEFAQWFATWHAAPDSKLKLLAYHLRHAWTREYVLKRGERMASEIAATATHALPVLREVNRGKELAAS